MSTVRHDMPRHLKAGILFFMIGLASGQLWEQRSEDELQEEFARLTDPTVYNRNVRPFPATNGPVSVFTRMYVYFVGDIDDQSSEFFVQLLMRQRWMDHRIQYNISDRCVQGEEWHKERMWTPTVYLVNQKEAKIIDVSDRNLFVSVCPDGSVYYSYRLKTTLSCDMHLRKFPFDEQTCSVILESWLHSTHDMVMAWEGDSPFTRDIITLSEFSLTGMDAENGTFNFPDDIDFVAGDGKWRVDKDVSDYSRLKLNFHMKREPGYYLLDYYIPSGFLVIVSWVSFWLSPDAAPARVTLGTSTMLTFITLSNSIKNSLPKVSYTKYIDIWLFICTTFIFLSLVEFAFVNTIHRRRKNVALKKATAKHVLKSTLRPSESRNNLAKQPSPGATRPQSPSGGTGGLNRPLSNSCGMLDKMGYTNSLCQSQGSLLVPPSPSSPRAPAVFFVGAEDVEEGQEGSDVRKRAKKAESEESVTGSIQSYTPEATVTSTTQDELGQLGRTLAAQAQFATVIENSYRRGSIFPRPFIEMTPPQIAKWIDIRSRWLFPICFLASNIVYWISIVI